MVERAPGRTPEETHALLESAFNAADADAFVALYEADAATTVPPSPASHACIRAGSARSDDEQTARDAVRDVPASGDV